MLRTKELDDIIGRPPHWLVQWGITLFFSVLLLVFALSYFIRYPETVNAAFQLHAQPAPVAIAVKSAGTMLDVLIPAGSTAHKNDTLFQYIESGTARKIGVVAPVDGIVALVRPISNGSALAANAMLFYIIPKPARFNAGMYVNSTDVKKIRIGEHVLLTFNDYPSAEYGSMDGEIAYVSPLNTGNGYYVTIELSDKLQSNFGKKIPPKEGLNGQATIVIEKKRLLSKFLKRDFK